MLSKYGFDKYIIISIFGLSFYNRPPNGFANKMLETVFYTQKDTGN